MKIDLVSDRVSRRPDPVAAAVGVFGHLDEDQVSAAEAARLGTIVEGDACPLPRSKPERIWSPKAILRRVTDLYNKLGKPKGAA